MSYRCLLSYVFAASLLCSTGCSNAGRPNTSTVPAPASASAPAQHDVHSAFGRLDKALDEAKTRGWLVVDMKRDWKAVFPR